MTDALEEIRILLVDDNASARAILESQLVRWRAKVTAVADPAAAMAALAEAPPGVARSAAAPAPASPST